MGLAHRPPHGGGGRCVVCVAGQELENPVHHAYEFSERLKGVRMLEIQSFFMTRQNNLDVRRIFDLETP